MSEPETRNPTPQSEHLQYLLTAYLFDSLSTAGIREVEAHLKTCAECRGKLEELRETLGLVENVFASDTKEYVFEERRRKRVMEMARSSAVFYFKARCGRGAADVVRGRRNGDYTNYPPFPHGCE
jgi:anti-sigma factor RsiW